MREIIGSSELERAIEPGWTIERVWEGFVAEKADLAAFSTSIRFACNGAIAEPARILTDGDEIAFLPPVSGG